MCGGEEYLFNALIGNKGGTELLDSLPLKQDVVLEREGRGVLPMTGGLDTVARHRQCLNHLFTTGLIL